GRLTVTLSDGNTQQDVQGTLVAMVSSPPVLSAAINDQEWNVTGEQSFILPTSTFSDPDFDVLTLSATSLDGSALPAWLTFDPVTGTFSGNPADASIASGTSLSIRVFANDGRNAPASSDFVLNFTSTPTLPRVVTPLADQTFNGSGIKSFTIPEGTFVDPEGQDLTYSATIPEDISAWLSFDSSTGAFSGNPPATAVPGPYTITVSAKDTENKSVSSTFKLWVMNANDLPTGNPIDDWTIASANEVTKDVSRSDFTDGDVGDGAKLELSAFLIDANGNDTELPSWITFAFDDVNGKGQFIAKAPSGSGSLTVRVYASDPFGGQGFRDFTVSYSGGANEGPSVMTSAGISSMNQRGELQLETAQKLELFSLSQGSTATLGNDFLREVDRDDDGAGITFTLTSTPKFGQLWLDSDGDGTLNGSETTLSIGSTFTQADIDSGLLKYKHTGSDASDDSFTFNVKDGGEDGALEVVGVDFTIQVTPKPAAPTLLSVLRSAPTSELTNADELTFKVFFSEGMRGVDASDFALTGDLAAQGSISAVTLINSKTYSVTVAGTGIANANGTLGLQLSTGASMLDTATRTNNVDKTSLAPTETSETYTLENIAPTVTLASDARWHDGSTPFYITLDFNEAINDLSLSDLTASNATLSNLQRISTDPSVDPDVESRNTDPFNPPTVQGNRYRVLVTPTAVNADVVVSLAANSVTDYAGNANTTSASLTIDYPNTNPIDIVT
ncbi:MAG TPA: putative Ig domain-containing protein, partial [Pseudomonadales bacterium]|nr:putative Ig domain-containing protein [Pseudomonadales bacterium]